MDDTDSAEGADVEVDGAVSAGRVDDADTDGDPVA